MQNFIKTIFNSIKHWTQKEIKKEIENITVDPVTPVTPDWSENDPNSNAYIKNRTHWEEADTITLVDNLTKADYQDGNNVPKCNFVPGQTYSVVWNGALYTDLVCYFDGSYNVIASYDNGYPFYIDDDGGDGLYVEADSEDEDYTVSIFTSGTVVHKIDAKYLPTPDWNQNDPEGEGYIENRPFYEEIEYITYIEEQAVTFTKKTTWCEASVPNVIMPWDEVPYIVTFDGVEYEGIMRDAVDDAEIHITLSDGTYMSVSNFGYIYISSVDYAGDHTIKVIQKSFVVHAIDSKYLGVSVYSGEGENSICANSSENVASGDYSHAEGSNTTASGAYSHVEGQSTTASGTNSHAEGSNTTASGDDSHAEGSSTTASGLHSHAEGNGTIASGNNQHVQGRFNIADLEYHKAKYAHIVGNGTFYDERSNAHTLDWNGVGWFQGGLQVGGNAQDDGAKTVMLQGEPQNCIILNDVLNNCQYVIEMKNGTLVSSCKAESITITTLPERTNYISGEGFDTTGMVVTLKYQDGTTKIIDNYTYDKIILENEDVTIYYEEYGEVYTSIIDTNYFTVTPFDPAVYLIDFDYTANVDGTYTLTGWKQTLNGEPSTEMIVPSISFIIL